MSDQPGWVPPTGPESSDDDPATTEGQQPPAAGYGQPGSPSYGLYGAPGPPPAAPGQPVGPPAYGGAPQGSGAAPPPPAYGQPPPPYGAQPPYGGQQYGAPQYGPPPPGQQYGPPQPPGPPQYGPPQYGPPQYGPPQYGAPQYGAPPPPPYGSYPAYPAYSGGAGYGYASASAPKPGVVPLRPLGVGEILDGALTTLRQNWRAMIGLSLVVVALSQLVQFVLTVTVFQNAADTPLFTDNVNSTNGLSVDSGTLGSYAVLAFCTTALEFAAATFLTGVFATFVSQAVLGRRISLAEAWQRVKPRLWPLIGLSAAIGVLVAVGIFICFIPGIYMGVVWAVAAPALILERGTVGTALSRSNLLVRNRWWRTFGILVLTRIIVTIISAIVSFPFVLAGGGSLFMRTTVTQGSFVVAQLLVTIGAIIGGALTTPFTAAVHGLLYVDLRMRKEGLDLELMRASGTDPGQQSGPGGPPSYGPPSYGPPSYGTPTYGTPTYGSPTYGSPTYGTPPDQPPGPPPGPPM